MNESDVLAELPQEIRSAVEFEFKDRDDGLEITHGSVTNEVFGELYDVFVKRLGGRYIPATRGHEAMRRYWIIPKQQKAPAQLKKGVTPLSVSMENQIRQKEEAKETVEAEEPYSLKKSVEKIGKLYPVLKDKFGTVIDGFHRLEIDPNWPSITLENIDTPLKLQKARLTSNFHRRQVPKEEMDEAIGFLIGAGLSADQIAEEIGIGRSTVFKHMPQVLKDKTKVEAGRKGGEATAALRVDQTVKTQDTTDLETSQFREIEQHAQKQLVDCGICGKPVHKSKAKPYKDKLLCPDCWESLPKEYRKVAEIPKPQNQVAKPSDFESWRDKKARMHPKVSKFDEAMLIRLKNNKKLRENGWKVEFQKPYVKTICISDVTLTKGDREIMVFFDHPETHKHPEEDKEKRWEAKQLHNVESLPLPYNACTETECKRVENKILASLEVTET